MLPAWGTLSPYIRLIARDKWPHTSFLLPLGSLGEPQIGILLQNCPGLCPGMAGTQGAPRGCLGGWRLRQLPGGHRTEGMVFGQE